ncbi:MAG: ATPase [Xylanivirga thermophila]|jgi:vacuolar-type H+-ATPase subunit H|uniref:ATPase n=1 Tax=Xylanivirga thermophila TaxID=2496273 RepID=UPI00101C5FCC|nr:ATPase [Xylanivirga thermophila]
MNILDLLDELEDELDSGSTVPFTGKTLIVKERCLDIIRDIRLHLPEEIKQGEWIKKERQRILIDAQKEGEAIVKEAEQRINALVDENQITQMAYQQARQIVENAQDSAKEIRLGSREYANGILEELETYLKKQIEILEQNKKELNSIKK